MTNGGPTAYRYRAFISYSHRDAAVARWLHSAIENYRVPRGVVGREGEYGALTRRLGRVFRDEEELAGAAELGPELENALRDSAALIVICSPACAKSRWVDHEIRFFKRVNPDRPVLAVIAEGEPGGSDECFPGSLCYGVDANGEIDHGSPKEPLAPDLQKLDRTTVKLKLIAGLLGVGYNDLARRELKRSRRRTAVVTAVVSSVMLALTTLSGVAVYQWRDAEKKLWLAETQREICLTQGLIEATPTLRLDPTPAP